MLAYIIDLLRRSYLVRYWAPVFMWMATIFYFSSRPNPLDFLPSSRHTSGLDKLAHIGEYAVLAALLHRALREPRSPSAGLRTGGGAVEQESKGEKGHLSSAPPPLGSSALVALAYALFDEIHQELAPGRGFELADVGYDLVGIIAALGVIWARGRTRS